MSDIEAFCSSIYKRTHSKWLEEPEYLKTYDLAYRVLYTPPRELPPLLILALNPGAGGAKQCEPELCWPNENEYLLREYPFSKAVYERFEWMKKLDILTNCVGANINFFRSSCLGWRFDGLGWANNPPEVRRRLEQFCLNEVKSLVREMRPNRILLIGMKAFDLLAAEPSTRYERDNARLCCRGAVLGFDALGVYHLTGARVSTQDRDRVWTEVKRWLDGA